MKISLNNAGKNFNREWIFRNFDFTFTPRNKYAITGPNGSGKSTLLQVLSAAITLNEGSCDWIINNESADVAYAYNYISFAAPYFELIEEMTAKEFLRFHRKFKPYIQNFSEEDILNHVDLTNVAGKQIRYYSSGMKQRLKLGQAFFSDTPAILLDEPCTNLDLTGIDLYYKLIEEFTNERLLIVSSNDKKEYSFCNEEIELTKFKPKRSPQIV